MLWLWIVLCLVINFGPPGNCDNFPSLLTTNATIAIVIDHEYIGDDYKQIREAIEEYLIYAKREILKHGGVNVQWFSWTTINVKRDLTAMISIAACKDTWKLFHVAEDENLLHIAISESDCPRLPPKQAITVPLLQRGEEVPQLVLDLRIMSAYKWNSAVVLYDDTLERDMVTRVVTAFTAESKDLRITGTAVSLVYLPLSGGDVSYDQTVTKTLSTIDTKMLGTNFLAIVSLKHAEVLMKVAKSLGMVNIINQWLYVMCDTNWVKEDISHLEKLLQEGDNVAFIYNSTIVNKKCTGGLKCHAEEILEGFTRALDAAIVDEAELASQVSDEEWEAIRPTKLERRNDLLRNVKNFLLTKGSCDNCTTWRLKAGETWGQEYQFNASEGTNIGKLLDVGTWRPSDGPTLVDELFPHVAHGFRGKTLPFVSFHNPPWQILQINETGSIIEHGGLIFDVLEELARSLNFSYTVELTKDDPLLHGNMEYDNTSIQHSKKNMEMTEKLLNTIPESMIQLVTSKTVVLAACGFTISEDKKSVVNFTDPISIQTYTFMVARPRELSRVLLFMSPFTYSTWLCLSISVIVMGPALFLIHRYSPVYEYKGISVTKGGLSSVENCMWYMYGALLQQGGMHLPSADSARLVVGTWWLVVLVVATTYCGNLVAFLTFPKIDIPITTVDELLAHKDTVTWSVSKGSYFEHEIKALKDGKFHALYEGMVKKNIPHEQMIREVEGGKHIYFDWKTKLQYYMKKQFLETERCNLALAREEFFDERIGIIIAPDTPYLVRINAEIKRLHQVGLIEKWFKKYLPTRDRCFKVGRVSEVNNHTVNMDDMQGSFFVLFLGFLIGACWLIVEKLWHRHYLKKTQKVQPYVT